MKAWGKRSKELAYLLNPAFCGRLICATLLEYHIEAEDDMPFPLIYLILPIVLHEKTRNIVTSRTDMINWINQFPEVLVGFPERTRSLIKYTNEAIEFLMANQYVYITNDGKIELNQTKKRLSNVKYTNDEIAECISKSKNVARWFARTGNSETIYLMWGIRP